MPEDDHLQHNVNTWDHLVDHLRLAVRLRMERRAHAHFHPRHPKEIAPDMTSEHRVTVADDRHGKPVKADDVVEEGTRHGCRDVGVAERNELRVLGSTIVRMTDLPPTLGRASMKSIEMSAQTCEGTSRGCSSPAGRSVSVLLRWHVTQDRTQSRTSAQSPGM